VDSGTLKVYDYTAAASRTSGSQTAAATFALAPGNTNPVGIADSPPADMLLAPVLLSQPSIGAFDAEPASGLPTVAGIPSFTPRDAVFALLVRESLPGPVVSLLAGGAPTLDPDSPTPVADPFGGQPPLAPWSLLPAGSRPAIRSEPRAVGRFDGTWIEEESQAAWGTDHLFAGLVAE
jgi:hypothetical protein